MGAFSYRKFIHGVAVDTAAPVDAWTSRSPTPPTAGDEDLLERLEREETTAQLRRAMAQLRATERKVLTLCDVRGMTYAEAARMLGVMEGTVRSRLHRAHLKLRKTAGWAGLV
ncbi:MAG: RNA polymerase sigma factor [Elusimicrobia bacterium]|nr:RNA polymerase sigma factor [Elusimicrobiota bacterium]